MTRRGLPRSAREKLLENEGLFYALFAGAATGIAVAAPGGRYLQANAAYCRLVGYTQDELRDLDFAALTHPDDLQLNVKLRNELLSGARESFLLEKRYVRKGGDLVWVRHSVAATRSVGGDIKALVVIAEDISERKLAEDALRSSEERLRLITNLVPHGIFAKDAAGRHIFANAALAELAGMSAEEILGKDDFDLVADKAQAEGYRADDRAVIQSGQKMVISEEARTDLSGRTRFLQTTKIPFNVPETGEPAVLGVCVDITERKRVEARFRRLVDSNVQGFFFWNTTGQITGANDAFLRMVGYGRADLTAGRVSWAAMTPPELAERDRRALKELAVAGVCEPFEKTFIRQDGSRVPIFVGPALFEDNREEGFCFVIDLSERKKLEQQKIQSDEALGRAEIKKTIAEESSRAKSAFLAMMSHELRTPLNAIIGFSEVLIDGKFGTTNERQTRYLHNVLSSGRHLLALINSLLDLSKIEAGKLVVMRQPCSLVSLAQEALATVQPLADSKQITLVMALDDAPSPTVNADPIRCRQVFYNFLSNSIKFTPNGGRVTVACVTAPGGTTVRASVSDTGPGIKSDDLERLFKPFTQLEQTELQELGGTGLGLALSKQLVELMGGEVGVSSTPGQGSTFFFELPMGDV